MLKLGAVVLDGTKIHAALSYERAGQIEMQRREEVGELTVMADAADQAGSHDGKSVPEELARREKRLAEITRARDHRGAAEGTPRPRAG